MFNSPALQISNVLPSSKPVDMPETWMVMFSNLARRPQHELSLKQTGLVVRNAILLRPIYRLTHKEARVEEDREC